MKTEYADTTLIVELDVTRKELKAKNESLGEMELDLKGKQDELSKIQEEFEKYKMLHECMLQILSNI